MSFNELVEWLRAQVAAAADVPANLVDPTRPFHDYGLESVDMLQILGDLEIQLGRTLDPALAYEHPSIARLAAHLSGAAPAAPEAPRADADSAGVAIVGIGCRVPGAHGPAAFWRLLMQGVDAIGEVPADRWSLEEYYDPEPLAEGKMNTRFGGFLGDVHGFDHAFFGVPKAEALAMDPQQRLLAETAWEALQDANLPPSTLAGSRTGVFVGISHNDYERIHLESAAAASSVSGTGNALSIAANRLSYLLDARGPSLAVDTACSSSLVAIQLAVQSLRRGECDLALGAGVNILLGPEATVIFSKARMMAPDGRCKTFDARANGYVRGEGAGVVVLKRLADAQAAGDPIYAVIRGVAVNQDGRTNGLSAPNPAAQEAVLRAAYADAGVDPSQVSYVEAHGTGTRLGDPIEAGALARVVGAGRAPGRPCWVGSVKTNIGHLESAAGVAGLIKAALIVRHGATPPSLHFRSPNPDIPFGDNGLQVVARARRLAAGSLVGVSAFGFGGTNAHAVLGSPPPCRVAGRAAPPHLFALSASSAESLQALKASWLAAIDDLAPKDLYGAARAAAVGRDHQGVRFAAAVANWSELQEALSARPAPTQRVGKLAFVFPGQGSQHPQAGRRLAQRFAAYAQSLRKSERILARLGLSLADELDRPVGESRIDRTEIAQPAIVALQIAMVDLLAHLGVRPDAVVGHSIGEVTAAYAAGALSRAEALRLALTRGRLMADLDADGAMLSVAQPAVEVEAQIAGLGLALDIAAVNAPGLSVVAGRRSDAEALARALAEQGVATQWVRTPYAFHSRYVQSAAVRLPDALRGLTARALVRPLYSTVTGGMLSAEDLAPDYWARNLSERVRFADAIERMRADGFEAFVDVGPDAILTSALKRFAPAEDGQNLSVWPAARRASDDQAVDVLRLVGALYERRRVSDLSALFTRAAAPVRAPTSPWARTSDLAPQRSRTAGLGRDSGHPLLGREAGGPAGAPVRVWSQVLSLAAAPWLADHKVGDEILVPAAAIVDLFLKIALAEGAPGLADIGLDQPLRLSAEHPLEILVRFEAGEDRPLKLWSRRAGEAQWRACASARLAQADAKLTPLPAPADAEEAPVGALYGALKAAGLAYGPAFQSLTRLWRGEDVVAADLRAARPSGCEIAPAALDGAFQALAIAFPPAAATDAWVPVRIGEVLRFGRGSLAQARARLSSLDLTTGRGSAEVTLFDEQGEPGLAVSGLELRRLAGPPRAPLAGRIWTYVEDWEDQPDATASPGAQRWLVLGDEAVGAERLAASLEARGDVAVWVASEGLGTSDENARALMARALAPGAPPLDGVICLWPLDAAPGAPAEPAQAARLVGLLRALAYAPSANPPRLWLATRGARTVEGDAAEVAYAQAPVWGLGLAAAFEMPDLSCSRLDLSPEPSDDEFSVLADLVRASPEGDQFAMRQARVLRRRIAPASLPPGTFEVRHDAAYVITGGFGALGLTVADGLAQRGARRLTLVGRSVPSRAAEEALAALAAQGVDVTCRQADVGCAASLAAVLDETRRQAPICGVFHAAGVLDDGPLSELDLAQLERAYRPKVAGAWNLHTLTASDPLDAFVVFSSAAASLGSIGQGAYMAANTFMAALCESRRRSGSAGLAIDWGPWADAGMAAEAAASGRGASLAGVAMIVPQDGVEALFRLIAGRAAAPIVLPYDLRDLVHVYPAAAGLSIFERLFGDDFSTRRSVGGEERRSVRPDLARPFVEPRSELEGLIAGIWRRALNIDRVGAEDPFFELGGDSVFASQVLMQINRTLGVALDSEEVFADFTVATIARLAEAAMFADVENMSDDDARIALAALD